jgi:diguanylate cyclase (GGDEF)-like protein/PAS domain S-box-containing protein
MPPFAVGRRREAASMTLRRARAGGALLILLLLAAPAESARRSHYFDAIGSAEGLSQNSVTALARDSRGFVWVATQGGLHRFDGYRFDVYQHDPDDPASLPDNLVSALATDAEGRLWIGTQSRFLAVLDPHSGRIERHRGQLPADADPLRDRVTALRPGAEGSVYVGTAAGVEHYDPATGTRRLLLALDDSLPDLRGVPRTTAIELDREGQLWVASPGGLHRIDPVSGQVRGVGPAVAAFALHRDGTGQVWAGTLDGLLRIGADEVERIPLPDSLLPGTGQAAAVWQITSDQRQRLWLAMLGGGLLRYDPGSGDTLFLQPDADVPNSLPESTVLSMMVDPANLLWIGTQSRGIVTSRADGDRFPLLIDTLREDGRMADNHVRAVLENADGSLWVGTDSNGLKRVDPVSGRFDNHVDALLAAMQRPATARGIRIQGLAHGADGRLWVGSDHGLFNYDPARRQAELVSEPAARAGLVPDSQFRFVRPSIDGQSLWLGTSSAGLMRYWPASREWRRYPHDPADPASIAAAFTTCVHEDPQGRVWVGTINGLNLLDPASGQTRRFRSDPDDPASLSGNVVRAVLQSADGRIWVATHNGLNELLDETADGQLRFRRHGTAQGLPSNTVYGLQEDRQGYLWLSTNQGLARMRPGDGQIRRFSMRDGLQELEYNGGADVALADGKLAFGGIRGLNVFDPALIQDSRFEPPLVLTHLRIGNHVDHPDAGAALPLPGRLEVPQAARVLRLGFAALDYTAPKQNQFRYQLEGFDQDWIEAGVMPELTYTNLDPGEYRLRVRGTNHDGIWSGHEIDLALAVVPPWWSSAPARALYLFGALSLLAALVVAQRRRRDSERDLLRKIRQREERLKLSLWGSGDEFWDWDVQQNIIHRVGADQLLGEQSEQRLSTDDWRSRALHPDDLPRVQTVMQAHITGQTDFFESEHRIRNVRGEWIWVRSRGKVVERDAGGNPLRIAGTARDITISRRAEGERRIALEVLRSMGEAVGVIDLEFRFVAVNPAFSRITGYSESEVRGQPSSMLDSQQHSADFYRRMRDTAERLGHWKGEMWQKRKDGAEFLGWIELSEVRDGDGSRTHFVAVVTDITDKKHAEQELLYLANYDTLTGLANRTLLGERLRRAVIRARRQHTRVAVLFLDLDRFKDINDSLGHAAGDRILKAAAARLLATVRETDTVARLGGDEFTVILEDLSDPVGGEEMAARIIEAFAEPLDVDGRREAVVSPSIGVALFPDHGSVPTDLLKYADTAMYEAKARGRNTWQLYTEAMDADARRRASVVAALRRALERGELHLVYQPKLSLHTGRITGVEALLRWNSADLGEVPPSYFIPLAEETGLILPIGEWVLREAAMTLASWRQAGLQDVVMAVNVSMLQLLRSRLAEQVAAVVADAGVPPALLELEVTESMVMANAELAIRVMRDLKRIGLSLAIDDFGTGYSSLVYLKRLPIDTLKIDKEFVGDLTTDPDDEAITATVITMAHSLGLNVVAEGVETDAQLMYLRDHGCDEIQGFRLARPLEAQHCLNFIRAFRFETLGMEARDLALGQPEAGGGRDAPIDAARTQPRHPLEPTP